MIKEKREINDKRKTNPFAITWRKKLQRKCIGCGTTKNVTKCDNTMCLGCWSAETEDKE